MKKFEHGGNIYAEKSPTGKWLDFSANINPLGLSTLVRKAIIDNLDGVTSYPDPAAAKLKAALAAYYIVAVDNIILGNGAAELFYLSCQQLRPKRALVPVPSFGEYERSARSIQAEIIYCYLKAEAKYQPNVEQIIEAMGALTCGDMLILGNPNNPTGNLLRRGELLAIVEHAAGANIYVVVDESFLDFLLDESDYAILNLVALYDNLIVIRSLTKFYAIPGLRLGFGVLNATLREKLEQGKDVWNVNTLAQAAGVAALADGDYQQASRELIAGELAFMQNGLDKLYGVKQLTSRVNFILLRIVNGLKSKELIKRMKQKGILIRDCSNYEGLKSGEYVRIAVRKREENECLLKALEVCLDD